LYKLESRKDVVGWYALQRHEQMGESKEKRQITIRASHMLACDIIFANFGMTTLQA
jgi:hypothetical protein